MRVNQIMSSPAVALDKDRPVTEALEVMKRNEISRLVVLQDDRIAGVVTEKDIARELGSPHAYRLPTGRMHLANVMIADPLTVAPDVTVKRAAELMLGRNISGLPVVEVSNLVGIITKLDFAKVCVNYDDVYVGQVMQAMPATISPAERVVHARKLLLEGDLLALPVMENKELVGIVTIRDVAMKLAAFQETVPSRYKSERIRNFLVGDIMIQPPTTVCTDARLSSAAKLMFEKRFSSLPVVNLEKELVGLLTKTELAETARERL